MITVKNLSKQFNSNQTVHALTDVSLNVSKGDIFGIIGLSGAGKSTLIRCLSLLENPTAGEILIDGKNISTLKGKELLNHKKEVGVIFQGYNLLKQKTVFENIAFPLKISKVSKSEIKEKVESLLKIVGLQDKACDYPYTLSGGQCQRVAIARALALNPKILLCDEPTSALDAFTTQSILDLLKQINKDFGVTIVIITHEIGVVKSICNNIGIIEKGKIVDCGTTKEVFLHKSSQTAKQLLGTEEL